MRPARKPPWLKTRLPGRNYADMLGVLRSCGLHTVCEEAACPNLGECWESGTATFMILGGVCTRSCGYCGVKKGVPQPPDAGEPAKVGRAVKAMGLGYAVVTSVTRDDLRDGGARAFAETVREIRKANPGCRIELLVPDFSGRCLRRVVESGPDVLGHNTETVRRLFPAARPKGSYEGSLRLLNAVKKMNPRMLTKSGLMVGLGETAEEVLETMEDMRSSGCDLLTVGQYLRPSGRQLPVKKYYSPGEFREFGEAGKSMGFLHVESGPLVRSSYMAERCFRGVKP